MTKKRIRIGMIGGGETALIGAVHRIAMRLDDRYELVAGALDADPERGRAFALSLGIAADRAYASYQNLIQTEAGRPDRIDAVVVVTPNFLHFPMASMALEASFDVICEKPMTTTLADAEALVGLVMQTGRRFFLTHTYTGYPMVRQAREMVAQGAIGKLRRVEVEYLQDWLAAPVERDGVEGAEWRTDPARAGAGGAIGDIGTHGYNLAAFVAGEESTHLLADLSSMVAGRNVDDDAMILMRYASGARGALLASQVLPGNGNNFSLRIFGDGGGLEWRQEIPEDLWFTPLGEPRQILRRNGADALPAAIAASRVPAAHPEGYLEAFANLYRDAADVLSGIRTESLVPGVKNGIRGMVFIDACLKSQAAGNSWIALG